MKIKTSELMGAALNWAVAMAEEDRVFRPRIGRPDDWDKEAYEATAADDRYVVRVQNPNVAWFVDWTYSPSTNWAQGGPIIEREGISVQQDMPWSAFFRDNLFKEDGSDCFQAGPTPLVAAMRCYVTSRLGDEVEIPNELTEGETV